MSSEILTPRLVIATGIAGTGKSTTLNDLSRLVPNSFILDKDLLNQSLLHLSMQRFPKIPPVEAYLSQSGIDLSRTPRAETPFGEMYQIDPGTEYYYRHVRNQVYITMIALAGYNLRLGKIPIIDCLVIRDIITGTVRSFMDQDVFFGYPQYLIHFIADEEQCYQRLVHRAAIDRQAAKRDGDKISSKEAFHHFLTEVQPMIPSELAQYKHLLINTSNGTPFSCAQKCLYYISN